MDEKQLSEAELGSRIMGLSGRLASAMCRWLLLVAEFDRRECWTHYGLWSTPIWLQHYCGIAQRTAVEHVRVARALESFPRLAEEMGAGRLSYSHVRAISRVLEPGETELAESLINVARTGTVGQLETMVRGLRTVEFNEKKPEDWRPDEYVRFGWTSESQWRSAARLAPERGAVVERAVAAVAAAEDLSSADALVRLAEIGLAALADDGKWRELRGDERAAVVIHLDAAAIPAPAATAAAAAVPAASGGQRPEVADTERSAERGRPFARVADGPGLPENVVRRLVCSGRIRTAVHGPDGALVDLGRSHRVVTDRMFRALLARDKHCRHPGCRSTKGMHAHHVLHWLNGGTTTLRNLILLCEAHHLAHHDGQYEIVDGIRGGWVFVRADGTVLADAPDPSHHIQGRIPVEAEHGHVHVNAARPQLAGDRLDRHWAVAVLAENRAIDRRARAG